MTPESILRKLIVERLQDIDDVELLDLIYQILTT